MRIGVGYRRELASWIESKPRGVESLEITAEHFFGGKLELLWDLSQDFALYVHGLGLSLGTPGPIDPQRLKHFAAVTAVANPDWISEHIAFTRTAEVDLGHLNPLPPTLGVLQTVADHAREVADYCGKPMLLENITSHVKLTGEMSETDFLNELCEKAGCGLLLDITNLFINSRNHSFDPVDWLRQLVPECITQLHIVGYSHDGDRFNDSHSAPIQQELIDLAREVMKFAPVKAIILERDEDFPATADLELEISKLERLRD